MIVLAPPSAAAPATPASGPAIAAGSARRAGDVPCCWPAGRFGSTRIDLLPGRPTGGSHLYLRLPRTPGSYQGADAAGTNGPWRRAAARAGLGSRAVRESTVP